MTRACDPKSIIGVATVNNNVLGWLHDLYESSSGNICRAVPRVVGPIEFRIREQSVRPDLKRSALLAPHRGVAVVVQAYVHRQRKPNLPEMVFAGRALRLIPGPRKRRQQHASQNGNNADDHEEFNQGETPGTNLP